MTRAADAPIRGGSRHERRRRAQQRVKAPQAWAICSECGASVPQPPPAADVTDCDEPATCALHPFATHTPVDLIDALAKMRRVIVCVCDPPDNSVHDCAKEPTA